MSGNRKKRLSMLDDLAAAGAQAPAPASKHASGNRALRAARDAVDGHNVWDLDPAQIENRRLKDRLEPGDIDELRDAIETNGQTVPILVRRHPEDPERYLLVYGYRRLEAIRGSDKVHTVRAIIANVDEDAATRAQISENMARRDLTFIERALFASELVAKGFGTQAHVAEILTVTKSTVSMALKIVEVVGRDLAEAIGPAPGIGRPRWEALSIALEGDDADRQELIGICSQVHRNADRARASDTQAETDPSVVAFEEVMRALPATTGPDQQRSRATRERISLADGSAAIVRRSGKGLSLDIPPGPFAEWLAGDAQSIIEELHARWTSRAED